MGSSAAYPFCLDLRSSLGGLGISVTSERAGFILGFPGVAQLPWSLASFTSQAGCRKGSTMRLRTPMLRLKRGKKPLRVPWVERSCRLRCWMMAGRLLLLFLLLVVSSSDMLSFLSLPLGSLVLGLMLLLAAPAAGAVVLMLSLPESVRRCCWL